MARDRSVDHTAAAQTALQTRAGVPGPRAAADRDPSWTELGLPALPAPPITNTWHRDDLRGPVQEPLRRRRDQRATWDEAPTAVAQAPAPAPVRTPQAAPVVDLREERWAQPSSHERHAYAGWSDVDADGYDDRYDDRQDRYEDRYEDAPSPRRTSSVWTWILIGSAIALAAMIGYLAGSWTHGGDASKAAAAVTAAQEAQQSAQSQLDALQQAQQAVTGTVQSAQDAASDASSAAAAVAEAAPKASASASAAASAARSAAQSAVPSDQQGQAGPSGQSSRGQGEPATADAAGVSGGQAAAPSSAPSSAPQPAAEPAGDGTTSGVGSPGTADDAN